MTIPADPLEELGRVLEHLMVLTRPAEIVEAGFSYEQTLAVEGPGWLVPEFEAWWNDEERRNRLFL